jgi:hydroxymethylpyrimidine/phosphomethylpyrimidine kinase
MVAGTGDPLALDDLVRALKEEILPLATIVTPNVPEAEALVGYRIHDEKDARRACRDLAGYGAEAVLLKGGHMTGKCCTDTFYHNTKYLLLEAPRIKGRGHGGGCILSSYLAANLAKGLGLWEAALAAKASINDSIAAQYAIGKGIPMVEPMGRQLREAQKYQVMLRLRKSSLEMLDILPADWVPDIGTNMVFALPGARTHEEVCALESRIVRSRDSVDYHGCTSFGSSRRLASVALTAMKFDGGMRSAINLRFSDDHIRLLRKQGLSIGSFERGDEPKNRNRILDWGTEDAIRTLGFVPDVIYDRGGQGLEPMIRLLASSPEELVSKFRSLQA